MLSDCKALPATDLWSLGCMIFRMHTGRYPFSAPNESLLFQKILLRDFEWPDNIDVPYEAKDIVERILEINPLERLGAGKPGCDNDYRALMKHDYFRGVNFEKLKK